MSWLDRNHFVFWTPIMPHNGRSCINWGKSFVEQVLVTEQTGNIRGNGNAFLEAIVSRRKTSTWRV